VSLRVFAAGTFRALIAAPHDSGVLVDAGLLHIARTRRRGLDKFPSPSIE